ncbi:sensor histidine kinase [Megalodesulfovibrio gigas]|uniref:histidine kinase n=1 Tax=Megalodesulfovibrio gigas (strain ATCC 19364 / DSM 1382 / NCIMB 9332 / VKM B-1759) TaxID=1121448 RepID=T2GB20_MEGG1|nr:ATP-binding protein [Megalodesulfovibrio gigas]AGW13082.1 putative PAS/PAC sensor signal transduction histidine kinase [Megalodesulfovibrio gigas DSM 1382 = ATCC 19364]
MTGQEKQQTQEGVAGLDVCVTNGTLSATDGQCLLESDESRIVVGLVGAGPGFMSIMELIHNTEYHDYVPEMVLAGAAEVGDSSAKRSYLQQLGTPLYDTWEELYAAHPDITLIIELTCNALKTKMLRERLPATISLVDQPAAIFFCGLHNMLQTSQHCRQRLDRQRALMQTIMDEMREDIMLLDREARVVDLNRHAAAHSGLPREALIGRPCWLVEHVEPGQLFCESHNEGCPFHATLRTGEAAEALMTRVSERGELRYYRLYSYPILSPQGNLANILLIRRDITERTRRERAQQQQEKLEIIVQESKRLESMLKSILDFAKPSGEETGVVDVAKIAYDTTTFMHLGYASQGYEIRFEQLEETPSVKGDATRLSQCLVNCIKNSVEAMPGGGQVLVRLGMDREQKGVVVLEIVDQGQGMSDEAIQKAFSPFFTTKESGAGLGLAMVKKTVEDFGGSVHLRSREGHGLTLSLHLLAA